MKTEQSVISLLEEARKNSVGISHRQEILAIAEREHHFLPGKIDHILSHILGNWGDYFPENNLSKEYQQKATELEKYVTEALDQEQLALFFLIVREIRDYVGPLAKPPGSY